jgi:hypothetical protein
MTSPDEARCGCKTAEQTGTVNGFMCAWHRDRFVAALAGARTDPWRHQTARDRAGGTSPAYLGDGVYVVLDQDGDGFWLTAEDGIRATDAVFFERGVCQQLVEYLRRHGFVREVE